MLVFQNDSASTEDRIDKEECWPTGNQGTARPREGRPGLRWGQSPASGLGLRPHTEPHTESPLSALQLPSSNANIGCETLEQSLKHLMENPKWTFWPTPQIFEPGALCFILSRPCKSCIWSCSHFPFPVGAISSMSLRQVCTRRPLWDKQVASGSWWETDSTGVSWPLIAEPGPKPGFPGLLQKSKLTTDLLWTRPFREQNSHPFVEGGEGHEREVFENFWQGFLPADVAPPGLPTYLKSPVRGNLGPRHCVAKPHLHKVPWFISPRVLVLHRLRVSYSPNYQSSYQFNPGRMVENSQTQSSLQEAHGFKDRRPLQYP